jgi:predicted SAM-dependent methyltransferase
MPVAALLAEHVWEHFTHEDAQLAARNCFEFLATGGYLRVAVPDGFHPSATYIEQVRPGGPGAGSEDHKQLYTYVTLKQLFEEAGFRVELLEYFDETGAFHHSPWDPALGKITRSRDFDARNQGGVLNYTSIILDARKA